MSAPRLSQTFVEALKLGFRQRGLLAFIPIVPSVVLIVPQFGSEYVLNFIINKGHISLGPILGSMIVMGGFLGSVSINVLTQIFSLLNHEEFSDFLKEEGVLDIYLFWPQFSFIIQMAFIFASVFGFVSWTVFDVNEWIIRIILFVFGLLIYASIQTLGLIDMVRTLAWHRQNYFRIKREVLNE